MGSAVEDGDHAVTTFNYVMYFGTTTQTFTVTGSDGITETVTGRPNDGLVFVPDSIMLQLTSTFPTLWGQNFPKTSLVLMTATPTGAGKAAISPHKHR